MQSLIATLLLSTCLVAHAEIRSLSELNSALQTGSATKVGFLTEGNFHAVQNELHKNVVPQYFANTDALHKAVEDGIVVAGLVSGTPKDSAQLNVFPSEQISVRAMLVKQGAYQLLDALDAALVRVIERGGVEQLALKNAPYEALVVHSCKPDAGHFEWPALANNSVITIASLGPYNWGGTDGDYTKTPFVGFWPDYYNLLEVEFRQRYNITFQRLWYPSSKGVLDAVKNGVANTTEPYMMIGSAYNGKSRKSEFDLTCITSATQDKYFAKKAVVVVDPPKSMTLWYTILGLLGLLLVGSMMALCIMYRAERKGDPVFSAVLLEEQGGAAVHP